MKIANISTIPVSVPLLKPFKAAYGIRSTCDFVIVKVETEDGLTGLGEAATIPIYDEGSQAGVVFSIEKYFKPLLTGLDPRNIGMIHATMDRVVKGERYAKSAIDYALYDLTAKSYGVPVYQLLGGNNRPVQVTAVFSASDPEQLAAEALKKKQEGYQVFKLKVGTEHEADVARVKLIRETIGYDVQLRLDGNEAWTGKEALKKIADFEPYKPAHIEQPVPHWDLNGLRTVRENSAVPIVIDESVVTLKDAFRVVGHVGGDILNIKTARSGGLFPSLKMAAVAESAGVVPLLGSMLELGIGTVANGHFCAALTGSSLASELVGPQFVNKDILKTDLEYRDGHLILPEGPGWGVELDEDAVRDFTVR
jgi:muconate/chloromuconate cycloisomerase